MYALLTMFKGKWCPQFTDSSKAVVLQEAEDSYNDCKVKVIRVEGNSQTTLDAAIAKLNR